MLPRHGDPGMTKELLLKSDIIFNFPSPQARIEEYNTRTGYILAIISALTGWLPLDDTVSSKAMEGVTPLVDCEWFPSLWLTRFQFVEI